MQIWAGKFFNEQSRIATAKLLIKERFKKTKELWDELELAQVNRHHVNAHKTEIDNIDKCENLQEILLAEARYTKGLYKELANQNGYTFTRTAGEGINKINNKLDHANYLAYGMASCALHTLGISYAFPVLHGKTRRGGLVFDIADLIKDGICLPFAFHYAELSDQEMRNKLIEIFMEKEILNYLINTTKTILCEK
jgi:CRISPR-associated protein Cas1